MGVLCHCWADRYYVTGALCPSWVALERLWVANCRPKGASWAVMLAPGAGSDVRWIRLCSRPPEARRWALGFCRGSWVGSGVHSLLFFPSALRLASDRFWATLGACSPRVTCKRPRYVMLVAPAGVPSWLLDILSWPWATLCRVWAGLGVLFAAAELTWVRLVFCAPPWVALGGGPWSFEQLPGDLLAHRGGCSARGRGLCIHQLGSQALGARVL